MVLKTGFTLPTSSHPRFKFVLAKMCNEVLVLEAAIANSGDAKTAFVFMKRNLMCRLVCPEYVLTRGRLLCLVSGSTGCNSAEIPTCCRIKIAALLLCYIMYIHLLHSYKLIRVSSHIGRNILHHRV